MRKIVRIALQIIGGLTVLAIVAVTAVMLVLGQWLQYKPPLKTADYLVPLGGEENRLLTAVELYKQGYAPTILLSNDYIPPESRIQKIEAELGRPTSACRRRPRPISAMATSPPSRKPKRCASSSAAARRGSFSSRRRFMPGAPP
jgi:hypothetical protein